MKPSMWMTIHLVKFLKISELAGNYVC